jgi:hypothetical protein
MQYAAVAVSAIGAVSWLGHLTSRESLYTWTRLGMSSGEGAMSRPSATVAILTGVSLFLIAQEEYNRTVTRRRPRARQRPRAARVGRSKRTGKGKSV